MPQHEVHVGDTIKWKGRERRIVKLLAITVALEGVDEVIGLPVDATNIQVFKDRDQDAA
jgi:hypothetical protein